MENAVSSLDKFVLTASKGLSILLLDYNACKSWDVIVDV